MKIPFNADGKLLSYGKNQPSIVWRENYTFLDTLQFIGIERGRSAAHFIVQSTLTGEKYPMFLVEVMHIFRECDVLKGVVSGKFTFVKRGTNYALGLAK